MTHDPFAPLAHLVEQPKIQPPFFLVRLLVLTLALALAAGIAYGGPKAESAEECAGIADMAITARAAAEEAVPQKSLHKMIVRMYPAEMVLKWSDAIVKAAYADRRPASEFSSGLLRACVQNRGVVEGFLGVSV